MGGQRLQLELEKCANIEPPSLVIGEKLGVAPLVVGAVEDAGFDKELPPAVVAIACEQRVVEVEQRQSRADRCDSGGPHSKPFCNHSLSSGTVTGRFVASEMRSRAASAETSEGMSRRPSRSR